MKYYSEIFLHKKMYILLTRECTQVYFKRWRLIKSCQCHRIIIIIFFFIVTNIILMKNKKQRNNSACCLEVQAPSIPNRELSNILECPIYQYQYIYIYREYNREAFS